MRTKLLPKGGIYEVNFGYRSKLGGYTTLVSVIHKLDEIAPTGVGYAKRKSGAGCDQRSMLR